MAALDANFVFVIPLRNPAVAQDWSRCVDLCRDTLRSAARSSCGGRVYVILACRDFPVVDFPSNVRIVRHPFPDPEKDWIRQHEDKYAKIKLGLVAARDLAPAYFMKFDADDLVSSRLASWVLQNDNRRGYFVDHGYRWPADADRLECIKEGFHSVCGSSNILYADQTQLPASMEDDSRRFDLLSLGHHVAVEEFDRRGAALTRVPFPAVVYRVGSGENITSHLSPPVSTSQARKRNWKFYVSRFVRMLMTKNSCVKIDVGIRNEFGMPAS